MNSPFRPPTAFIKASQERLKKVKSIRTQPPTTTSIEATQTRVPGTPPSKNVDRCPDTGSRSNSLVKGAKMSSPPLQQVPPTALTTPSKTAVEIEKRKSAREQRRATAALVLQSQRGLNRDERQTRVYRDEISAFRKDFRSAVPDCSMECSEMDCRIKVVLRKRPLNSKELAKNAFDVATTRTATYPNSRVFIHEPKTRVDLSKHLETHAFIFDHAFDETSTNEQVYLATGKSLVKSIFEGGKGTFFAYGQTGSGKTHTIFGSNAEPGIYSYICNDLFRHIENSSHPATFNLRVSFFEIYGPKIIDLLTPLSAHQQPTIQLCEDKHGNLNLMHLHHETISTLPDLLALVQRGRSLRTTRATSNNNESSRSHAIFQIQLVSSDAQSNGGVLSLVDLAGSERASTKKHVGNLAASSNTQKKIQTEGAEINKSLLSLKECIRALYKRNLGQQGDSVSDSTHVPFRGSKLTLVLRDSFLCMNSQTVMVATISPGSDSVEHTLNTMRYADRVKELGSASRDERGLKSEHIGLKVLSSVVRLESLPHFKKGAFSTTALAADEGCAANGFDGSEEIMESQMEMRRGRLTVSKLQNYGDSDSEVGEDPRQQESDIETRSDKKKRCTDMNALRDFILAAKVKPVIPKSRRQSANASSKTCSDRSTESFCSGNSEEGSVEGHESAAGDFYQDALSTESPCDEQHSDASDHSDANNLSSRSNATSASGRREHDYDADESEWRRYCKSSDGLSTRQKHIAAVQTQFLEMDNLLLERFRSGRLGTGPYETQLTELLQQRLNSLRNLDE
ncbi:hypothetical protein HDU81_002807 [Chytriomyces hyalinus]|nr:hypothetical protein HDU81_002807 [Chytriomyces hyalinus]